MCETIQARDYFRMKGQERDYTEEMRTDIFSLAA